MSYETLPSNVFAAADAIRIGDLASAAALLGRELNDAELADTFGYDSTDYFTAPDSYDWNGGYDGLNDDIGFDSLSRERLRQKFLEEYEIS